MAPKLLKTESQGARQCKTAQSSAGRASPALPVSSRRGGRQRPRPVKSRPGPQPQLPPPLTALGAGRRVPDSPAGSGARSQRELNAPVSPSRLPGYLKVAGNGALGSSDRPGRHLGSPEIPFLIEEVLFLQGSLPEENSFSLIKISAPGPLTEKAQAAQEKAKELLLLLGEYQPVVNPEILGGLH
ncbi:hypothetical protein NDU88_005637 [Pleurodeles waltl]|uniref:Uncharacterized protein n=1 Tax=Pleurodeles waltl TaxID=8319 RepID=A0AAV7RPK6_PLEWA|nr:hypothetical protein NDU88_005637 [Pleurodeles waltl]